MKLPLALLFALPLAVTAQETAPPPSPPVAPPASAEAAPSPPPAVPVPAPPQAAPPAYPPPAYAPQGPPAAPPPWAPTQPLSEKQRDRWYIGFGIGGGGGSVSGQGDSFSFKELNANRDPTTVFFNFKVGATLTPRLLVGLDISGVGSVADENGLTTGVSIANVDAVATFFPMGTGVFLRGGLGRSGLAITAESLGVSTEITANGFNVMGGVGYAFWLGQTFNLTVNLDLSKQWYGSSTNAPEESRFGALWLGFDWY